MKTLNANAQDNFKNTFTLLVVLFLTGSVTAQPMLVDNDISPNGHVIDLIINNSIGSSSTSINTEANDSALYELEKSKHLAEAQNAYNAKDWIKSRVLLNKFLALYVEDDSANTQAKYLLSKTCLMQSDFKEAIINMNDFLQRAELPKAKAQEIQFDLAMIYLKYNQNYGLEIMDDIAHNYDHGDFEEATAIVNAYDK